jgi:hypothetical protein
MKASLALAAASAALVMGGCIPMAIAGEMEQGKLVGSGVMTTKTIEHKGLRGLEVGSAFEVTITPDDAPLVVTIEDNLVDHLKAEESRGIMKLDTMARSITTEKGMKATIGIKTLESLEITGAANVTVADAKVQRLDLEMNGAGKLAFAGTLESVEAELNGASEATFDASPKRIRAEASGASKINFNNKADAETLIAELDGASSLKLAAKTKEADVELTGASSASLATEKLRGSAKGASSLKLLSKPASTRFSVRGASSLIQP